MQATFYPLVASKMLRHCEIFLFTMQTSTDDEVVELAFNEFVTSADRTIQYMHKEMNKIDDEAKRWFRNRRDNLVDRSLFYELRHLIAHHFFIPLMPIITINGAVPSPELQVSEYRLIFEWLPEDKQFDKKRRGFKTKYGAQANAIMLCANYFQQLSDFIKSAEEKYGNTEFFLRAKVRSKFRVNSDMTLLHQERSF